MIEFFDTHAHICSPHFSTDEQIHVLTRAMEASVRAITLIATEEKALCDILSLSSNPNLPSEIQLFFSAATPPHDAQNIEDPLYEKIQEAIQGKKLSAIGETGLDYFYHEETKAIQQLYFRRYLDLAAKTSLPIIVHCRNAFSDFFPIFSEYQGKVQAILHCFTGTYEEAMKLLHMGIFISISGIVTFPKSIQLQQIVSKIPLDHLLIETDSPYLAPIPFRGKRNEPAYVPYVAQMIAKLQNVTCEEIAEKTTKNGFSIFS